MEIDVGIRAEVEALQAGGIETIESCQGGEGHACPEPMVRFNGNIFEGFKAFTVAKNAGLNVQSIAYEYSGVDGVLDRPAWIMTFRSTIHRHSQRRIDNDDV